MAFENFPSATTKQPLPPEPPKTDWRFYLTIGLVIALLGTWAYIIWDKSNQKTKDELQQTQYSSVISEKDTLTNLLEEATMRYDALKTSNAKKDSAITAKDKEIAEKRSKIQSILSKANATKAELAQAKSLIASLNGDIESYKLQIETLKGENLQLTQEKAVVTQEKNQFQKNYDSAKSVIKQKESLIDVGSTLHASTFNIVGINEKKNGNEKETDKAKKVDKLKISFNLDENRIAESGEKELYICITGPDGKPIAVEALGSGMFKTREGEQKFYTKKLMINYTMGQKQPVSFDWKQNTNYEIGDYKITVYHNGFNIGDGTAVLKKSGFLGL